MAQIIGTQYYRPPFPEERDWAADIKAIKEAGLNAVQLWVVWAWVEAKPEEFEFDDYDRLIDLAAENELGVVLSTVAAIHPYWIHRTVPGSEMVTNEGLTVISTNRRECHFGLTPGGCIDHPGVWLRMERFLSAVVTHFRDRENLLAWDIWNELRWNVHADGLVCYCDHTVAAFRTWLRERYGGLDELNRRWKRRYHTWEDVQPGKRAGRTYTEMTAFQHFITDRSVEHGRRRYSVVKSLDPRRPVTLHGGKPTVLYGTDAYDSDDQPSTALHRGNDWGFAEYADAVGCSSFPVWEKIDLFDFTVRLDCVRSASRRERGIWLSELQGGMSAEGFTAQRPVTAAEQQRWVWTGFASRADTILFWSWRDELFGKESGGFGIVGRDGKAEERLAALRRTRALLETEGAAITDFLADEAEVGVWFSPQSYYLYWCQTADAVTPMQGIQGVARALLAGSVPYRVVEETHPEGLDGLKLLFMPRANVLDREQEERLERFLGRGGTIVVESEAGAYDSAGLYREPQERFLHRVAGIAEVGRRVLEGDAVVVDPRVLSDAAYLRRHGSGAAPSTGSAGGAPGDLGEHHRVPGSRNAAITGDVSEAAELLHLPATQWVTPGANGATVRRAAVGAGNVIALGSYCFDPFYRLDTERTAAHDSAATVRGEGDTHGGASTGDEAASSATPQATHIGTERLVRDLRRFVGAVANLAGVDPGVAVTLPEEIDAEPLVHARLGTVGDKRALVCFCDSPSASPTVRFAVSRGGMRFRERISGTRYASEVSEDGVASVRLSPSEWGVYWLVEE